MHKLSSAIYVLENARALGVEVILLPESTSHNLIKEVFEKFKPWKTTGHLQLGGECAKIPTDEHEGTFTNHLREEKAYLFFEQNYINKNIVLCFSDVRKISLVIKECPGMEYFITNEILSYLVAVNWYTIEISGGINLPTSKV